MSKGCLSTALFLSTLPMKNVLEFDSVQPIILWNRKIESGIELIDQQHKEFLQTANLYLLKSRRGHDTQVLLDFLRFLQGYVLYHFQAEESYMARSGYPRYREHQAMHSALATHLKFLSVKLQKSDYSDEHSAAFSLFLSDWMRQHLVVEDADFCRYYANQSAQ